MRKYINYQNLNLTHNNFRKFQRLLLSVSIYSCISFAILFLVLGVFTQLFSTSGQTKLPYEVGERLTYNIAFEKFENTAYAEIYVVSNGKLDGKDAYELSAKLKSSDLLSAAFYLFDDVRTTFVSAETGLPMYVRTTSKASGLPKESITSFLNSPTTNFDLLSLIYKVRNSGGAGTFSVQENESIYNFDFTATGGEVVKNDAGEFETIISSVQSQYLTDLQITNFRINFTNDEKKIPVRIRFRTPKGRFVAEIASIQNLEPQSTPELTPTTPTPVVPTRTPTPVATPTPYIENQDLSNELPFDLGETLIYKVSNQSQDVGTVMLQAKERTEFEGLDSLLLTAKVTALGQGTPIFVLNDGIEARVDPATLAPALIDLKFSNALSIFNQSTRFDQIQGFAITKGTKRVEVPVGTHSILSLAYAIRSFNLKPSLDPTNPVNDTRVAVFLDEQAYIFTLRPQNAQIINLKGEKVSAQLISITTGNPNIDKFNLRLWLSNDKKRVPLRFTAGSYQADLIESKIISPKN